MKPGTGAVVGPQANTGKDRGTRTIPGEGGNRPLLMAALFLLVLILSLAAATQYFAHAFQYHPALGANLGHLYAPWKILAWAGAMAEPLFYPVQHGRQRGHHDGGLRPDSAHGPQKAPGSIQQHEFLFARIGPLGAEAGYCSRGAVAAEPLNTGEVDRVNRAGRHAATEFIWGVCGRLAGQKRAAALPAPPRPGTCAVLCTDPLRQGRGADRAHPAVLGGECRHHGSQGGVVGVDRRMAQAACPQPGIALRARLIKRRGALESAGRDPPGERA